MKRHWWFLTLSWPNDDQGIFSTAYDIFFKEMEIHKFIIIVSFKLKLIHILVLHTACMISRNYMLNLSFFSMVGL